MSHVATDGKTSVLKSATTKESSSNISTADNADERSPKRRKLSPSNEQSNTTETATDAPTTPAAKPSAPETSIEHVSKPQSKSNTPQPAPANVVANARAGHLAALDKLAIQLLSTLADMSSFKINKMLFGTPSPKTHEYKTLKSQFEQTRRLLARDSPFLSAKALGISDATQMSKIRTANMATFAASAFSGELGLRMLDVMFLEVFVQENDFLMGIPGTVWLELKTQAFIAARRTASVSPYQAMLDLFPPDTEKMLLARHPNSSTLSEKEQEFMQQFNTRRETLYADIKANNLDGLHERHTWDDFSTALVDYLYYHYGPVDKKNFAALAARAYEIAREGVVNPYSFAATPQIPALPSATPPKPPPTTTNSSIQALPKVEAVSVAPSSQSTSGVEPAPQQVATKDLYLRAKQALASMDSPSSASNGTNVGQPRPWTQEEELALLAGIDNVKGSHWSQILNLYGPGGTISEVLRERTQDQLEDKAKTLRLVFVNAKVEIPHNLQLAVSNVDSKNEGQGEQKSTE